MSTITEYVGAEFLLHAYCFFEEVAHVLFGADWYATHGAHDECLLALVNRPAVGLFCIISNSFFVLYRALCWI